MSLVDLQSKRILVTQADTFMGPALCATLEKAGAQVIANTDALDSAAAVERVVNDAGEIDVLLANLAIPAPATAAAEVDDDEWFNAFRSMVDPLRYLTQAVLPMMTARKQGKILLMGSASGMRGIRKTSTYCAARGAQLAYIQSVALEVARDNVQVNAIAQNFVDNPTYFPESVQSNPAFVKKLQREVPLGRLVSAEEDATFAAYLCSNAADCFVGQIFPVCGGWVAR